LLSALCAHAEDLVANKLEEVYRQYQSIGKESRGVYIERLIKLDQELRRLIDEPWMVADREIDKKYWREKYQAMGLSVGHYSDSLDY
jgi:hypothetical protein